MSPQLPSIMIQPEVKARLVGEERSRRINRIASTTTNTPMERQSRYCHASESEAFRAVTAPKLQIIPAAKAIPDAINRVGASTSRSTFVWGSNTRSSAKTMAGLVCSIYRPAVSSSFSWTLHELLLRHEQLKPKPKPKVTQSNDRRSALEIGFTGGRFQADMVSI